MTWAQIIDYVAGDDDLAIEEHLMACAWCTAEAESALRITRALRKTLPPCVSAAQVEALRVGGLVIADTTFLPGARTEVRFARGVDLMIHHLAGLDLTRAERVRVVVRVASTRDVVFEDPFAPFELARGEVLIACQRHVAAFPPDVEFEVTVHPPTGAPVVATYQVPHVFEH